MMILNQALLDFFNLFIDKNARGAEGADARCQFNAVGGLGGYSSGNVTLTSGLILNIVVGKAGTTTSGGYNGGGYGVTTTYNKCNGYTGGGGGATHIALRDENNAYSTLASYGNETVAKNYVYIVAGGGGGAGGLADFHEGRPGGVGGGDTGASYSFGAGGGGCASEASSVYKCYSDGYRTWGGGGGGWYGGRGRINNAGDGGGGGVGGSGYIGGVTDGETISGNASMPTHDGTSTMTGNSGNGYVKITYISN